MKEDSLQSYGVWIRSKRKDRGLSIRQVSEATRIDAQYLKALEAGNIALLPEPYMRAFLKTYASYLGLNPAEALRRFEAFLRDQSERLEMVRGSVKEREARHIGTRTVQPGTDWMEVEAPEQAIEPAPEISRRSGMILAAALIVFFAVIVYLAVRFTSGGESSGIIGPAPDPAAAAVEAEYAAEQPSEQIELETAADPLNVPAEVDTTTGRLLIAEALEETWIEARADGAVVIRRIITEGNSIQVAFRDTLELWLGKNRGMRLILDGEEITDLGPPGMILRLVLTDEGVALRRLTYPPDTIPPILNRPPRL